MQVERESDEPAVRLSRALGFDPSFGFTHERSTRNAVAMETRECP